MKWIKVVAIVLIMFLILICVDQFLFKTSNVTSSAKTSSISDNVVFPHNKVVDVNIDIDEDVYANMKTNAMSEEIVSADITYNGYKFSNIGLRPKGNSSLMSVANSENQRYSYKIDFNYYLNDQTFFGITKLNLNNLFSDTTMMAEYLGYEMMASLDLASSRTTYVALSINGNYQGLYLSVEQVNETFLQNHFGESDGELYKPEMGTGSDLAYISDNEEDYTDIIAENPEGADNEVIMNLIKAIKEGKNLDEIFDVDSFLKYLAVSTMVIHLDSYQGGMFHNYYLYNNDGIIEWIPWDLNMAFNQFSMGQSSNADVLTFFIDEPVSGSMDSYPLVKAIMSNEDYVARYHSYMVELMGHYLEPETFENKVLFVHQMIKDYVKDDPTAFYSYDSYETALFKDTDTKLSLISFVKQRSEHVKLQLSGEEASTNNGEGNAGGGGMRGGGAGGGPGGGPSGFGGNRPAAGQGGAVNNNQPPTELLEKYKDQLPEGMMLPNDNNGRGRVDGMPGQNSKMFGQNKENTQSEPLKTVNWTNVKITGIVSILMLITTFYLFKRRS